MVEHDRRLAFRLAGWVIAVLLAVTIVGILARRAQGGELDPSGAPASTMQSIDALLPVWSQSLPANDGLDSCHSSRFLCVLNDEAVLDRQTGLVWERSAVRAGTAPDPVTRSWASAFDFCQKLVKGGRYGWRLPAEEELRSVAVAWDSVADPFVLAQAPADARFYWSARTVPGATTQAYDVSLESPGSRQATAKSTADAFWCVRGGQGFDGR